MRGIYWWRQTSTCVGIYSGRGVISGGPQNRYAITISQGTQQILVLPHATQVDEPRKDSGVMPRKIATANQRRNQTAISPIYTFLDQQYIFLLLAATALSNSFLFLKLKEPCVCAHGEQGGILSEFNGDVELLSCWVDLVSFFICFISFMLVGFVHGNCWMLISFDVNVVRHCLISLSGVDVVWSSLRL